MYLEPFSKEVDSEIWSSQLLHINSKQLLQIYIFNIIDYINCNIVNRIIISYGVELYLRKCASSQLLVFSTPVPCRLLISGY